MKHTGKVLTKSPIQVCIHFVNIFYNKYKFRSEKMPENGISEKKRTYINLGEEMEEKQQLEEQHRAVMDKFKYKRRQIRELQDDLQTMSHTLDNLCRDEDAYVQMIDEKQNKILQVLIFDTFLLY